MDPHSAILANPYPWVAPKAPDHVAGQVAETMRRLGGYQQDRWHYDDIVDEVMEALSELGFVITEESPVAEVA